MKLKKLFYLILVHFLIAESCFGSIKEKSEVTFNALIPSKINSFDPVRLLTDSHIIIFNQIYDAMFEVDHKTLRIVPNIVENYTFNKNLTKYTFHLKPKLKFHDGSPLTTKDIVFTLERVLKEKFNAYKELTDIKGSEAYFKNEKNKIEGLKIIDDITLKIELVKPSTMFLYALALVDCSILPSKYKSEIKNGTFFTHPIGSGAFMLDRFDKKNKIVQLKKFSQTLGVIPKIDILNFSYKSEDAAKKAFMDGQLDQLFPYHLSKKELDGNKTTIIQPYNVYYTIFLSFNFDKPNSPFLDLKNRKLLKKICDIKELHNNKNICSVIRPAQGYIPYGMPGFEEFDEYGTYKESSSKGFDQLIKIGMSDGLDSYEVIAQHLRKVFSEKKLNIELIVEDISNVLKNMRDKVYHAAIIQNYFQYPDSYSILKIFKSDNMYNVWHFKNLKIDSLLKKGFMTSERSERAKIYREINRELFDEVATINLFFGGNQYATFKHGWKVPSLNYIGEWFLKYKYIEQTQIIMN